MVANATSKFVENDHFISLFILYCTIGFPFTKIVNVWYIFVHIAVSNI